MRFNLSHLLIAVAYAAFVLGTVKWPFDATLVQAVYGICYATAVYISCHRTEKVRSFCIALSSFGLIVGWNVGMFSSGTIEGWLYDVYVDPRVKSGYWDVDLRFILDAHSTFIIAFIAAVAAVSFTTCGSQDGSQLAVLKVAESVGASESPS